MAKRPAALRKYNVADKPQVELMCNMCGAKYHRREMKKYEYIRKYCSESCRAKAWRENGKRVRPPAKPKPKPQPVATLPKRENIYRRAHEQACKFAGLTRRLR